MQHLLKQYIREVKIMTEEVFNREVKKSVAGSPQWAIGGITALVVILVTMRLWRQYSASDTNVNENDNWQTLLTEYIKYRGLKRKNVIAFPHECKSFSNRYPASFQLHTNKNGQKIMWKSSEQYMQYKKIDFIDRNTVNPEQSKILSTIQKAIIDSLTAESAVDLTRKALAAFDGQSINDLVTSKWYDSGRFDVLQEANDAKFSQNDTLKQQLLNTGNKEIIAVSGNERQHTWSTARENGLFGKNKAGIILMKVRDKLHKKQSVQNTKYHRP